MTSNSKFTGNIQIPNQKLNTVSIPTHSSAKTSTQLQRDRGLRNDNDLMFHNDSMEDNSSLPLSGSQTILDFLTNDNLNKSGHTPCFLSSAQNSSSFITPTPSADGLLSSTVGNQSSTDSFFTPTNSYDNIVTSQILPKVIPITMDPIAEMPSIIGTSQSTLISQSGEHPDPLPTPTKPPQVTPTKNSPPPPVTPPKNSRPQSQRISSPDTTVLIPRAPSFDSPGSTLPTIPAPHVVMNHTPMTLGHRTHSSTSIPNLATPLQGSLSSLPSHITAEIFENNDPPPPKPTHLSGTRSKPVHPLLLRQTENVNTATVGNSPVEFDSVVGNNQPKNPPTPVNGKSLYGIIPNSPKLTINPSTQISADTPSQQLLDYITDSRTSVPRNSIDGVVVEVDAELLSYFKAFTLKDFPEIDRLLVEQNSLGEKMQIFCTMMDTAASLPDGLLSDNFYAGAQGIISLLIKNMSSSFDRTILILSQMDEKQTRLYLLQGLYHLTERIKKEGKFSHLIPKITAFQSEIDARWLSTTSTESITVPSKQIGSSSSSTLTDLPENIKSPVVHIHKKITQEFVKPTLIQELNLKGDTIQVMQFSRDGQYLSTGGKFGVITIWSLTKNTTSKIPTTVFEDQPYRVYTGHSGQIIDLTWSSNFFLISASTDNTVRLWHLKKPDYSFVFSRSSNIISVCFHPSDNSIFLTAGSDKTLKIWKLPEGNVLRWVQTPTPLTSTAFYPTGEYCIAGLTNGRIVFYTAENLQFYTQIDCRNAKGKYSDGRKITGFDFRPTPNGYDILITSNDSRIRLLKSENYSLISKIKGAKIEHLKYIASFDDSYEHVISCSESGDIFIWRTDNGFRIPYSCLSHSKRNTNTSFERFSAVLSDEGLSTVSFLPGSSVDRWATTFRRSAQIVLNNGESRTSKIGHIIVVGTTTGHIRMYLHNSDPVIL